MAYTTSIDHIASYPPISAVISYLLSFQFVNYAYQQFLSAFAVVDDKALSPYLATYLTKIDETFDSVVLGNIDTYVVPYLPVISSLEDLNPVTLFAGKVLAPVNTYVYDLAETYVPAPTVEGKAAFKLSEIGSSEYEKSYLLVKEIGTRAYEIAYAKVSEVSSHVTSTNFSETAGQEVSKVRKQVTDSYESINKNYIQPLKTQTQDYVTDVKSKADSFILDAKNGVSTGFSTASKDVEELTQNINGTSIPVN